VRVNGNTTSEPHRARSAIDQRAVSAAGHVLISWIWLERQARTIRAAGPARTVQKGISQ
jgi:hypothetical protein